VHVWCGVVAFSARAVRSPPNVKTPASRSVLLLLWLRPFFCSEASNPAVGWQGTCQWVDGEVVWAGTLVVRWCCTCNTARRCWHVLVCCLLCSDLACRAGKMIFASSDMTDRWVSCVDVHAELLTFAAQLESSASVSIHHFLALFTARMIPIHVLKHSFAKLLLWSGWNGRACFRVQTMIMRTEKALSPTVGRIDLDREGFVDTPSKEYMPVVYLQGPRGTERSALNSNASGDLNEA